MVDKKKIINSLIGWGRGIRVIYVYIAMGDYIDLLRSLSFVCCVHLGQVVPAKQLSFVLAFEISFQGFLSLSFFFSPSRTNLGFYLLSIYTIYYYSEKKINPGLLSAGLEFKFSRFIYLASL